MYVYIYGLGRPCLCVLVFSCIFTCTYANINAYLSMRIYNLARSLFVTLARHKFGVNDRLDPKAAQLAEDRLGAPVDVCCVIRFETGLCISVRMRVRGPRTHACARALRCMSGLGGQEAGKAMAGRGQPYAESVATAVPSSACRSRICQQPMTTRALSAAGHEPWPVLSAEAAPATTSTNASTSGCPRCTAIWL